MENLNNDQKIILDLLEETKGIMEVIGKSAGDKYANFKDQNIVGQDKGSLEKEVFKGLLSLRIAKGRRV